MTPKTTTIQAIDWLRKNHKNYDKDLAKKVGIDQSLTKDYIEKSCKASTHTLTRHKAIMHRSFPIAQADGTTVWKDGYVVLKPEN